MSKLKIAIQKSGRLSEKSLEIFKEIGILISNGERKLKTEGQNFPIEIFYLRSSDIPEYVEKGVVDIGIVGENEAFEQNKKVNYLEKLNFGNCRLSLAIPKEENYSGIQYFNNKKVATSFPNILSKFCLENNINIEIEEISGSVEIAPGIGLSDAIFDIVSTGSTLLINGLKEVEIILKSQAILIANQNLTTEKAEILNKLLFRIESLKNAYLYKYILMNVPNNSISSVQKILPGMRAPSIIPLISEGWSSVHSVVKEDEFWNKIDELKSLGAEGILVVPIEKMIL